MELPLRTVIMIIILLIVLGLIIYGVIHQGILSGFGNILDIGGDWLDKLFSPP